MKLIALYLFALVWSHGQARGIGAGLDRTADSLNDDVEEDSKIEEPYDAEKTVEVEEAKIEEQYDAEASVEVEEPEEEVLKPTIEDEVEKAKRLIPILMRLQKKYPTLGRDEQVKVLRQASGYKEDFKEALDKLEASPEISHDLDIPYLRQILGVARVRNPKKASYSMYDESPVETNIIPKGGEGDEYQHSVEELSEGDFSSGIVMEDSMEELSEADFNSDIVMEGDNVEELSEADLERDIVVEGLFATDFDPNSIIVKEGLFATDFIDPNSDLVTVGLFAGNKTDADDEDLEDFPFARAASFVPFSDDEDSLPIIPPPSPHTVPMDPSELPPFPPTSDPLLDAFHEIEINLNFAAPFPTPKRKPSYRARTNYPRQPITYLPPPPRSFSYPPPVARPLNIFPLPPPFPPTYHQPLYSSHHQIPSTPTYHRPLHSSSHHVHRRSTTPSHHYPSTTPPHHYPSTAPPHHYPSTAPPHHYPSQQMYHYPSRQSYHPYWDTSYQQASRYQPLRYGEYNPYAFDYQTSASLDDPNLTAHYPSDYYGYSMQSLPSLRPSNPFSSMQSPALALNPHYQYSRAAYNNFLHESMDGQDPVKYVRGLTGS